MPDDGTDVVLRATGLTRRYAGVTALSDADLELCAGEVHALVGENGAGKSTLVRLLSGVEAPDAGRIEIDGAPVRPGRAAGRAVAVVAQELSLFGDLTVAENLFPDRPATRGGLTSARLAGERAGPVLDQLGLAVAMDVRAGTLELADRQLLEVCRAVVAGPRVLILDEPTSSLPAAAVGRLQRVIRTLVGRGIAVLYISHFLEEVLEIADRVTVLRDGRVVRAGVPSAGVRVADLVEAMLGGVAPARAARPGRATAGAEPVVRCADVEVPGRLAGVTFEVRPGEIVGVAGLEGAGHLAALEVVSGRRPVVGGTVELAGRPGPTSLREALRRGVALVPRDRKRHGLLLDEPVWLNVAAARWLGLGRGGPWLSVTELAAAARRRLAGIRVRSGVHQAAGSLSGGNQQKVVLAKWLETDPVLLVLDDPTRGVDVGARVELHDLVAARADRGTAVLTASTDVAELATWCDRVLVFRHGRITDELAGERLDQHELAVAVNVGAPPD